MAITDVPTQLRPTSTPDGVRSFLIGAVVGAIVVFAFSAGAIVAFGGSVGGALAVGGFCAVWGGPGFGGMMGFVLHQDRQARRAAAGATESAPPRGR